MPGDANTYHLQKCRIPASGLQRSGEARGDCLTVCPLKNSSIEQWRVVVIVTVAS